MALNQRPGPRRVTVLGSTGSVGKSTVSLLEAAAEDTFEVVALVAGRDWQGLAAQARRLKARHAVLADATQYAALKEALAGTDTQVAAGPEAVIAAAGLPADWTMAAIVGAAGLPATMAALARGGIMAIANKESLVCAGEPVLAAARAGGATILPVDSEHNAIFQALDMRDPSAVAKIILTASGGPCRTMTLAEMVAVTPEVAVRHPVWSMGAKISVDSATMFNKGLELIEAARLVPVPEARIDVLVHPQDTVLGIVQYTDGSVLAQLGTPDMRTPIAHALAWPARMAASVPPLDLIALGKLEFFAPDPVRFPALRLSREALRAGRGAPTILNAANEIAVGLFLEKRLRFLDIAVVVEETLMRLGAPEAADLTAIMAHDAAARSQAGLIAAKRAALV